MQIFVCIAGLPIETVNEIRGRPQKRFTGDAGNPAIAYPIKPPFAFRAGMAEAYLLELAKRIEKVRHSEDVSIVLVYVNYGGSGTVRFIRSFFPFALAVPVEPFYPSSAGRSQRRENLRSFVRQVEAAVDQGVHCARTVRDVLSGRNFSPLLLPVRNFRSKDLPATLDGVFSILGMSGDPREVLARAEQEIGRHHPLQRTSGGKFFQDDRDLRFRSPGRDRHGMARLVRKGHLPTCFLGSRVRFGGPFDSLFHYDCDYESRGLDKSYVNCHEADCQPGAKTHVNIAPNDAVR